MEAWVGELIGTAMLVFLGTAVVANVILKGTKGEGGGLIVITVGWALAVMLPAIIFAAISGSIFNPALTLGLAVAGELAWSYVLPKIAAQMAGGFIGAFLTWLFYKDHFDITEDKGAKLGVFATGPAIRKTSSNFISEFLATFMLVFMLLGIGNLEFAYGLDMFGVGGIILVLGVCLGGTTGYALNPARDLAPRLWHAIAPIKDKGTSDWAYSWIPVVAPIVGAISAALLAVNIF